MLVTGADVGAGGAVDGAGTAGGSVLAALGSTGVTGSAGAPLWAELAPAAPAPVVLVGEPAGEPEP